VVDPLGDACNQSDPVAFLPASVHTALNPHPLDKQPGPFSKRNVHGLWTMRKAYAFKPQALLSLLGTL